MDRFHWGNLSRICWSESVGLWRFTTGSVGLSMATLFLASCGRSSFENAEPKPIPSMSECIEQSMTLVRGQGIFERPVIVTGARLDDGSIRVLFSRAPSDKVLENGRKDTRRILHVDFTWRGAALAAPLAVWPKSDSGKCRTAATVCRYRAARGKLDGEFEIHVTETNEGYRVTTWTIPYKPRSSASYRVSPEIVVTAESPGP